MCNDHITNMEHILNDLMLGSIKTRYVIIITYINAYMLHPLVVSLIYLAF